MAIESLMQRGRLADWQEFAEALSNSEPLARRALRVCEYVEDRGSAALARMLVFSLYPELRRYVPVRQDPEAALDAASRAPRPGRN